jgi:3D-(3,5/4)-trihydroxycyclohexane-1,2-dione acylhydrolase (decyclizing)
MSSSKTIRLTMAQALVRYLSALTIELEDGTQQPYCAGVWSIFGHGNVVGLGEALYAHKDKLTTFRAHNEQAMAHTAIAFAKTNFRQRIMAVTTSIGPGATNLVTAAALAHVNRLPVLFLPGDTFASRSPDPVLQQVESFTYGDVSANETLRPVVRYFDRIMRPEQLLQALPRAIQTMIDPATCGPVCLALPQDVQAEAFDYPVSFFEPKVLRIRRPEPDKNEVLTALQLLKSSKRPFIVAGGGVLYSQASQVLAELATQFGIPVGETQAGKSSLGWDHPLNLGSVGVAGTPGSFQVAKQADVIIVIGSRLQDFTTGSNSLFNHAKVLTINVQSIDAAKSHAQSIVADAKVTILHLIAGLQNNGDAWKASSAWTEQAIAHSQSWRDTIQQLTSAEVENGKLPYDAEVIGRVQDSINNSPTNDIVVCAAGTLPAELHKLWRSGHAGGYHADYGFSCMGYEIAAGIGAKMARPDKEVIVMVGDGSYLMMNSEIATSVMLDQKMIILVLDNRGFGCISRLQVGTGSAPFNNLLTDCVAPNGTDVHIDFAAHAKSLGAESVHVKSLSQLSIAMSKARAAKHTQVIVIDTTHTRTTEGEGAWWEVGVPEVSERKTVIEAQKKMLEGKALQIR